MGRPLVVIESPYAGDVPVNEAYARRCLQDSIRRGEAPFASHLLYTQVLDDTNPEARTLGLSMAEEWSRRADAIVVYCDHGISTGMGIAVRAAIERKQAVIFRWIEYDSEAVCLVNGSDHRLGTANGWGRLRSWISTTRRNLWTMLRPRPGAA